MDAYGSTGSDAQSTLKMILTHATTATLASISMLGNAVPTSVRKRPRLAQFQSSSSPLLSSTAPASGGPQFSTGAIAAIVVCMVVLFVIIGMIAVANASRNRRRRDSVQKHKRIDSAADIPEELYVDLQDLERKRWSPGTRGTSIRSGITGSIRSGRSRPGSIKSNRSGSIKSTKSRYNIPGFDPKRLSYMIAELPAEYHVNPPATAARRGCGKDVVKLPVTEDA